MVKCEVCGATFDEALGTCPICGAGLESCTPVEEEVKPESNMVKCMVCGEVFDKTLEKCPVCGAGLDQCEPVAGEAEVSYQNDTDEKFIILGGGPAAHYAAGAIRERNATASIIILTNEAYRPYNRPMLTKALLSDFTGDEFAIAGADWYENRNIIMAFEQQIVSIDTEAKEVVCENAKFSYDKLIYALGARCFVPPIKGADQGHVISIRNIADTEKVHALMPKVKKAVVIGGGVMGIEAAWDLCLGGVDVTILETAPGLLPKQLDDPASEMLEKIVNSSGMKVICGAMISEITEDKVVLADGSEFEAQLVIMSTGMRPNTAVAQEAGIQVDKFVVVDENMKTSAPDVFACGDCTEFNGQPQAFWAQAIATGAIAGANAAGDKQAFTALGSSLVINAMDTSIFALGTNGKDGKKYRTIEDKDPNQNTYKKFYFNGGKLVGVILIGDISKMVPLTKALMEGVSVEETLAI